MVRFNCFKLCIMMLRTLDKLTSFHGGDFQNKYYYGIKYKGKGARFLTKKIEVGACLDFIEKKSKHFFHRRTPIFWDLAKSIACNP